MARPIALAAWTRHSVEVVRDVVSAARAALEMSPSLLFSREPGLTKGLLDLLIEYQG